MLEQITGTPSSHVEILGHSRVALRRSFVEPLTAQNGGAIGELRVEDNRLMLHRWSSARSFEGSPADLVIPLDVDAPLPNDLVGSIASIAWLFGPERVKQPDEVLRLASHMLSARGLLIVATECPWRGKILAPDEYAEPCAEEAAASLIRAGFGTIERHVDGPFFRIWSARVVPGSAHELLAKAAQRLEQRDHFGAEQLLSSLNETLSEDGIREFGLLVAGCHDMAGRRQAAVEALSQILEIDPGCARALCGLGRLAALNGDLETATQLFDRALLREPALVAALRGKSAVAEARGHLVEAYSAALSASDLRPIDDNLLVEVVRLGRACGRFAETERFLRDVSARRPLSPMVSAVIGDAV